MPMRFSNFIRVKSDRSARAIAEALDLLLRLITKYDGKFVRSEIAAKVFERLHHKARVGALSTARGEAGPAEPRNLQEYLEIVIGLKANQPERSEEAAVKLMGQATLVIGHAYLRPERVESRLRCVIEQLDR